MKNLIIKGIIVAIAFIGLSVQAQTIEQTAELTIEIKGIKEAKGQVLIAIKSSENPEKSVYEMLPITEAGTVSCLLKNIPVGKVGISAFQDLNGNNQLEMDEALKVPVEPCYSKEKHTIRPGENKLTIKLINVKEMMGL